MPAPAPDELKTDQEVWLWQGFCRLFDDQCGTVPALWPERRAQFIRVAEIVIQKIKDSENEERGTELVEVTQSPPPDERGQRR